MVEVVGRSSKRDTIVELAELIGNGRMHGEERSSAPVSRARRSFGNTLFVSQDVLGAVSVTYGSSPNPLKG